MRKQSTSGLIMFAMIILAGAVLWSGCGKKEATSVAAGPAKIDFITSYDGALKLGQEKNQKVLIDFYTDWCQWCKKLDTETYVDSAVVALSKNIVFAKLNAEVDTVTAAKYSVKAYPTIVLLNNDGTEIDRIAGYLAAPDYIATVNEYLNGVNTLDYFLKKEADSGSSLPLNSKIADKYADRGKYAEAEVYYQKVIGEDPDNQKDFGLKAMMSLADVKMRDKKYDEAIGLYGSVLKRFPTNEAAPDAEIMTAIAYRQKPDTAMAIKAFEQFIKNHPQSADTAYAQKQIEKLKNIKPAETAK